ncbi:hypothetical protein BDZ45DRAFT_737566 [Acephala macrosclerotiorum]|nr:hypothetical protein BDZ45DRAFT_737566 [Acephala macrosclerotiorum]
MAKALTMLYSVSAVVTLIAAENLRQHQSLPSPLHNFRIMMISDQTTNQSLRSRLSSSWTAFARTYYDHRSVVEPLLDIREGTWRQWENLRENRLARHAIQRLYIYSLESPYDKESTSAMDNKERRAT